MTKWQLAASNGRKTIYRTCLVLGQEAAEARGRHWVAKLGAPWTLAGIQQVVS